MPKKFNLGQIVDILANIGVLLGIVFLGLELQQNNELLSAEARFSRIDRGLERYSEVFSNPELASALGKLRAKEELSSTEEILIEAYALRSFRNWESNFEEVKFGTLDESKIQNTQRAIVRGDGGVAPIDWARYWKIYKQRTSNEFIEWMEGYILETTEDDA